MSSSGAPRVLVADGDSSIRSLLAAVVQHMKLEPVIARDVNMAVTLANGSSFAAAIVDAREEGPETLARLTAACPSLHGNIIIITTLPAEALGKCAGAACVLRKPFQLDELQNALRRCCGG